MCQNARHRITSGVTHVHSFYAYWCTLANHCSCGYIGSSTMCSGWFDSVRVSRCKQPPILHFIPRRYQRLLSRLATLSVFDVFNCPCWWCSVHFGCWHRHLGRKFVYDFLERGSLVTRRFLQQENKTTKLA